METVFAYIGGFILVLFGIIAFFLREILTEVKTTSKFVIIQDVLNEANEKKIESIDHEIIIIKKTVTGIDEKFNNHIKDLHHA